MSSYPRIVFPAFLLLALSSALSAQSMPQMGGLGGLGKAAGSTGLSDSTIASGLKQALSVGTENAVKLVDKPGGYSGNSAIKILLPKDLRPAEGALRAAGMGPKIDSFVVSMNKAAESAAPAAEKIFADAVTSMSIDDARKLLNGGDTSITDYFKSKTSASLAAAFHPAVEKAMNDNDVTQQYQALSDKAPKMPFMKTQSFDINKYVVDEALDGLFYMLGQQEQNIRHNPSARTTGLLKQVFAK